MYYLKNTNFWMFGLFFFFYFFIMGAYFPFFPIWLHDINHISKSDTGIIFAAISLFSLLFQPLFGLLSDKLGLRKYLLWIITGMLVMFAPFFIFIFGPLLQYNILVGSIVGGIYLGFCFNAGAPAVEAFIEKVSRRSNFEFGRARMFGCVGWALCASIVGIMFTINNQFVFWLGSGCALWNCSDSQNCGFCHCMLLAFPAPTMFLTNSLLISLLRSLLPVNRVRGYLAT